MDEKGSIVQTPPIFSNKLHEYKQTSRKSKHPRKAPEHSCNSVVLKFQLLHDTPLPSLRIKATGSHWFLKARRKLFSQSDTEETRDIKGICSGVSSLQESSLERKETAFNYTTITEKKQYKGKVCASCKTKKTPLWRDSEDGTPYCNACGIRFKKYRISCPICSYIPRKDENLGNLCCRCGSYIYKYS